MTAQINKTGCIQIIKQYRDELDKEYWEIIRSYDGKMTESEIDDFNTRGEYAAIHRAACDEILKRIEQ